MSRKQKAEAEQPALDLMPVEEFAVAVRDQFLAAFDETAEARRREASGDARVLKVRRDLKKEYENRLAMEALCREPLPEGVCKDIEEARAMLRWLAFCARQNPQVADALSVVFPDHARFGFCQLDVVLDQAIGWVQKSRQRRDRFGTWTKWRRRMSTPKGMVAVAGDTYPVRTYLRNIGGKWDAKAGCWYVPREKLQLAILAVNNPEKFSQDEEAINERHEIAGD